MTSSAAASTPAASGETGPPSASVATAHASVATSMLDVGVGPRVPVAALPIDSLPVGNGDGSGGEGGSCTSSQTSGCGCCSPLDVDVRSSRGDLLDEPLEEEVSAPVVGMGSSDSAGGGGASLSASPPDGEQPWSCVGKQ